MLGSHTINEHQYLYTSLNTQNCPMWLPFSVGVCAFHHKASVGSGSSMHPGISALLASVSKPTLGQISYQFTVYSIQFFAGKLHFVELSTQSVTLSCSPDALLATVAALCPYVPFPQLPYKDSCLLSLPPC